MGQVKLRGTFEQRQAEGVARRKHEAQEQSKTPQTIRIADDSISPTDKLFITSGNSRHMSPMQRASLMAMIAASGILAIKS